jgi:activator of 2-hydroxyglutaryl-CoA dehydratase
VWLKSIINKKENVSGPGSYASDQIKWEEIMNRVGIDIGSTTVKTAILDESGAIVFSAYERHFANIQETLKNIISQANEALGDIEIAPMITGSGGLTIATYLDIPFVQEVVSVATSLKDFAPQTDVAIELGGEDAKIIYFTGGIEQRMNGIWRHRFFYRPDGNAPENGRCGTERVCQGL